MKKNVLIVMLITAALGLMLFSCNNVVSETPADGEYVVDRDLSDDKSICGANDLQYVNSYDGSLGVSVAYVQKNKTSVGALESSSYSKYCTGTLIGRDLFLTAGHCVDSGTTRDYVAFNYEYSASGGSLQQDHYRVTQVLENEGGGLDYAILRLEGNPGDKYGWKQVSDVVPAKGALLAIIQHPSGRRKQIEAGTLKYKSGVYLSYGDLDTEGGSSGSGILNAAGQVVGVHTLGGCSTSGGQNSGVSMDEIKKYSPIIRSLLNNSATPTPVVTKTPTPIVTKTPTPIVTATATPTVDPIGSTWNPGKVYNGGDRVKHGGYLWEAKWWTQGDEPGADQWGPWKNLGPIGGATPTPTPIVTVGPTKTPTATPTSGTGYPAWALYATYNAGDIVTYNGKLYKALVAHTAYDANWNPASATTLWTAL